MGEVCKFMGIIMVSSIVCQFGNSVPCQQVNAHVQIVKSACATNMTKHLERHHQHDYQHLIMQIRQYRTLPSTAPRYLFRLENSSNSREHQLFVAGRLGYGQVRLEVQAFTR